MLQQLAEASSFFLFFFFFFLSKLIVLGIVMKACKKYVISSPDEQLKTIFCSNLDENINKSTIFTAWRGKILP